MQNIETKIEELQRERRIVELEWENFRLRKQRNDEIEAHLKAIDASERIRFTINYADQEIEAYKNLSTHEELCAELREMKEGK